MNRKVPMVTCNDDGNNDDGNNDDGNNDSSNDDSNDGHHTWCWWSHYYPIIYLYYYNIY